MGGGDVTRTCLSLFFDLRRATGKVALFLGENLVDEFAVDVGEAIVSALKFVGELGVVESHEVEDGGVKVVDGNRIFEDIV